MIGAYAGYFGAAAGVLMLALLLITTPDTLARCNALKNVVLGISNVVAAVIFAVFGPVHWLVALPLAGGVLVGGRIGPVIVRHSPTRVLRVLIALAGLGLAIHARPRRLPLNQHHLLTNWPRRSGARRSGGLLDRTAMQWRQQCVRQQSAEVGCGVATAEDAIAQRGDGGSFERVVGVADVGSAASGFLELTNAGHLAVTGRYSTVLAALDGADGVGAMVAVADRLVADTEETLTAEFDRLCRSPLKVLVAS